MDNLERKKISHLIVDTSAFIKNAALQDIGDVIMTVPEVVNEIKSKRQIRRLVVLPYDLVVKETFPENVTFVTEFSKKTGDYPSLSATDIQVMALTYQLEKEKVGIDHLKDKPVMKPVIESQTTTHDDIKNIEGFYHPHKKNLVEYEEESDEDKSNYDSAEEDITWEQSENPISVSVMNHENHEGDIILRKITESDDADEAIEEGEEEEEDGNEEDDDDEGWITPSNIKQLRKLRVGDEEEPQSVAVACLTTDYAMQNVLKQIGLNVVSLDGKVIKQLRTFILRCYGCFKTTSVMTKVFCPNCGNKTLKKVGVSVNPDGTQKIHINFRRPLTARGKKFSLPKPQGGKHANNPVLCEDQPMPQQRPSRLARSKNNPLHDDYIAGYSPFVTRDVTSKSAMLGIRPHVELRHWMKKNPNEARHKGGKKKK